MASSSNDNDGDGDGIITIQLEDTRSDAQMCFEAGKVDDLRAVLTHYSNFRGVPLDSLKFARKGKAIDLSDTPAGLGMSDGDNVIQVSLTGRALTEEEVVQACTAGSTDEAVDLLSKNSDMCQQPLTWFDSDGQELKTPPLFIAIDYGHVDLVSQMLPLHEGIINTLRDGDGDYSLLQWASFAVSSPG